MRDNTKSERVRAWIREHRHPLRMNQILVMWHEVRRILRLHR